MTDLSRVFLSIIVLLVGLFGSAQAANSPNLYRNKDHAFSILFPSGWQQRAGQTPSTVVVSENREGDSIIIQVRQLPKNITLDEYSDNDLQALIVDSFNALKRRFSDATMQNSGITYISNKKAIWMLYSYSVKEAFSTRKVTTMYYQVWYEARLFGILCTASSGRYAQVSSTLLNSVRSFVFEDPSWYRK